MECIRVYNSDGDHKLSILPCSEVEGRYDLCTPDGEVLYCDVDPELVEVLALVMDRGK